MSDVVRLANEFDHWDATLAADPYPVLAHLRDECPVAWSPRHRGFWVLSRYDDVDGALRDHRTFSSETIAIPKQAPGTILAVPPLDQDPPEHTRYRQMLLPFFTPGRTAKLEPGARETARELAEGFADEQGCELVSQYTFPMPTVVLAQILGVEGSDYGLFVGWIRAIVEEGGNNPKAARQANQEIYAYLTALLKERAASPRDDLLSYLLTAQIEGRELTNEERLGIATLLLIAGIDTTTNTMSQTLWHLAADQEAQAELRKAGAIPPGAIEEILRLFSPVSLARVLTDDVVVEGCPIPRNDQVLLSLPAANRDRRQFDQPDELMLDRNPNPHVAFGAGIHRCIGAHIARMELRVGLEEFLAATRTFRLDEDQPVTWKPGPIRGPKQVQVRFH